MDYKVKVIDKQFDNVVIENAEVGFAGMELLLTRLTRMTPKERGHGLSRLFHDGTVTHGEEDKSERYQITITRKE